MYALHTVKFTFYNKFPAFFNICKLYLKFKFKNDIATRSTGKSRFVNFLKFSLCTQILGL